jgi:hypothetical protein
LEGLRAMSRRLLATFAACIIAALVGLFAFSTASSAAPRGQTSGYPPSTCSTVSVSTTQPSVHGTVVVSGSNFEAGTTVTVELHTTVYVLGSATVQPDGTFSLTVTLPSGVSGAHHIVVTGGDPDCPNSVAINIGNGVSPHPPSKTGVNIAVLLAVALALIAVGLLLNGQASARRRRKARHTPA